MINILQISALVFGVFALSRAFLRAKDRKLTLVELLLWIGIWSGLLFVVFFPKVVVFIADFIGVGRGVDFIIYTSLGLLFYLVFRLYVKIEEQEIELTKLVREIALMNKKKK